MRSIRSLDRDVSPPALSRNVTDYGGTATPQRSSETCHQDRLTDGPSLAAIEAGRVRIEDHLSYFSRHLSRSGRKTGPSHPRITIDGFKHLYTRNEHSHGRHFVIHQHDHPIAGVHYDLRLQFSESSTLSWSIPYGMPGNPNSMRPNRMAIETRVHTLWNNLVESASYTSGSLLIWDTGEYEILEKPENGSAPMTDGESSDDGIQGQHGANVQHGSFQNEKLIASFRKRNIKLRLHGARLPKDYTVTLRLPSANDRDHAPRRPVRKRRRKDPTQSAVPPRTIAPEGETDSDERTPETGLIDINDDFDTASAAAVASEGEQEDELIRQTNAYPGAHNTVGSVHQRRWFLTLDSTASGFSRVRTGCDRGLWRGPWKAFYVMGRDVERSVVTGRNADDVMADEGVEQFVGRKMWQAITR